MKTLFMTLIALLVAGPAVAQESPQALVDAAKKEGTVVLYGGGHTREGITTVAAEFEKKYGIKVEFTRKGTGEVAKMVEAERLAGAVRADLISVSDPGIMMKWARDGVLAAHRVPNAAVLPKNLQDPNGFFVGYSLSPLGIMYNTRNVSAAELPKKWTDLLQPRWKGKVVHADPGYSGTALTFVNGLSRAFGPKFYEEFGKNKPLAVQSSLAVPQMVLSGEAPLGVPAIESLIATAKAKGEPLGVVYPEDGVVALSSDLAVLAKAPHPNAGRLLMDFHLSEQMQKRFVENGGRSVISTLPAPAGTPPTSTLKYLWADTAWLADHRTEQIKAFEKAVLGK